MEKLLSEIKFFKVHPCNLKKIGTRLKQMENNRLKRLKLTPKEEKGLFDIDKEKKQYKF